MSCRNAAVCTLSFSHTKPGRGSLAILVSHLDVMIETIGHLVVSWHALPRWSLFDRASDWSAARTWKTWRASHLSQTCCISDCDTPQEHWNVCVYVCVCWSLGVISQNKTCEVFMRLLLRNLSYVTKEGKQTWSDWFVYQDALSQGAKNVVVVSQQRRSLELNAQNQYIR